MKNKTKVIGIIVLLLIIIGVIYIIYPQGLTANVIESRYTYTKAICNSSNFCQDYEIICVEGDFVEMRAITGATIQLFSDWQDPRDEKIINSLCE